MNRMQLKTQSWCQGGILRGRPCVLHHTRTGSEWPWSPTELHRDVMLTALAPSLFVDTGFLFVSLYRNMITHAYAFRTQFFTDRCRYYTRYLERTPYNEQFNSFDKASQPRLGSIPFGGTPCDATEQAYAV